MKYILLSLIILVSELFIPVSSYAAEQSSVSNSPTAYYCIGTNLKPPCNTHSAATNSGTSANISPVPSTSPSPSNPSPSNPSGSPSSGTVKTPCGTKAASVGTAQALKLHAPEPPGLLQNFTQNVIQSFAPQNNTQTEGTTQIQSTTTPCSAYEAPSGLQQISNKVSGGTWTLKVSWNAVTPSAGQPKPTGYTLKLIVNTNNQAILTKPNVQCNTAVCTYTFTLTGKLQSNYTVSVQANSSIVDSPADTIQVTPGQSSLGTNWSYAAPTNLQANVTTKNSQLNIALTWQPVTTTTQGIKAPTPSGYTVELDDVNGVKVSTTTVKVSTNTVSETKYTYTNIKPSLYVVKVWANGGPSAPQSASVNIVPPTASGQTSTLWAYAPPPGLKATTTNTSATVTWKPILETTTNIPVPNAANPKVPVPATYTVGVYQASNGYTVTSNPPTSVNANKLQYTENLPAGSYEIRVWGNGGPVAPPHAQIPVTIGSGGSSSTTTSSNYSYAAPKSLTLTPSNGSVKVTWSAVTLTTTNVKLPSTNPKIPLPTTYTVGVYQASNGYTVKTDPKATGTSDTVTVAAGSYEIRVWANGGPVAPPHIQKNVTVTGSSSSATGGEQTPIGNTGSDAECTNYTKGAKCVQTNGGNAPPGYTYLHNLCLSNNSPTYLCEVPTSTTCPSDSYYNTSSKTCVCNPPKIGTPGQCINNPINACTQAGGSCVDCNGNNLNQEECASTSKLNYTCGSGLTCIK